MLVWPSPKVPGVAGGSAAQVGRAPKRPFIPLPLPSCPSPHPPYLPCSRNRQRHGSVGIGCRHRRSHGHVGNTRLHRLVFPYASTATHVAVITPDMARWSQSPLAHRNWSPLHASEAAGGSKLQALPHATVLLVAQVSTGGAVSTTVTVELFTFELPAARRLTCWSSPPPRDARRAGRRVATIRAGHSAVGAVLDRVIPLTSLPYALPPPHNRIGPSSDLRRRLSTTTVRLVADPPSIDLLGCRKRPRRTHPVSPCGKTASLVGIC